MEDETEEEKDSEEQAENNGEHNRKNSSNCILRCEAAKHAGGRFVQQRRGQGKSRHKPATNYVSLDWNYKCAHACSSFDVGDCVGNYDAYLDNQFDESTTPANSTIAGETYYRR